ncbi:MAG: ABC transporter substrate-binding protein [Alphaproteobacteria bacterium]|nr:ABC transporter substrate-binding protein [Alphaproteobacteria bacterium]
MDESRIVSLLPSATEIVAILGARDRLVGRSHECDFPPNVTSLPVCTAARLDATASSRDIDRAVKHALKDALAVYDVFEDQLQALSPKIVVTQDQCDVCAVPLADVETAVSSLTGQAVEIVTLHPSDLDAVYDDIRRVGTAIGAPAAATAVVADMTQRCQAISTKAETLDAPSVACIEWTDPLMAAGNWVPELVSLAGGRDVFGIPGKHAPWITWEGLRNADPDIIVFMPCGFGLTRCREEAKIVAEVPGWRDFCAVKSGRVYVTDGNSYFNRPGPRLVDSLEIMAEILHPEIFAFGHETAKGGSGWARSLSK